jgi:hypothetical protein
MGIDSQALLCCADVDRLKSSRSHGLISLPHRFLTLRTIFFDRVSVMRSMNTIDFWAYVARCSGSHVYVIPSFSAIHAARSVSTGVALNTQ